MIQLPIPAQDKVAGGCTKAICVSNREKVLDKKVGQPCLLDGKGKKPGPGAAIFLKLETALESTGIYL